MPAPIVAVAYSGGRDSSALLHATLAVAMEHDLTVLALHVHHGLSLHADAWLKHCEQHCKILAARSKHLRFAHRRLDSKPAKGESVEAWARMARYRALREMAADDGASVVLLAHHRLDQAETVLLQALRGGGVAGLAAMPKSVERAGVTWLRPWLDVPRSLVEAYAAKFGLTYVDDDSNADPRFARNRLRLGVWGALQAAFPQAESALADTARWAREAQLCADELAAIDLEEVGDASALNLKLWARLSPARRSNALRAWLKKQMTVSAPTAIVQRLTNELLGTTPAQWLVDGQTLRRYRGRLTCVSSASMIGTTESKESVLMLTRAGSYELPGWAGRLQVRRVKAGGVALSRLARLHLVERTGGEQFQIEPRRPPRALKKQYQSLAVPVWERGGPLIYVDQCLIFVPGLGVDARVWADCGVPQVSLSWLPE